MGMRDDKSALLEQAERCRRPAHAINTTDVVEKLLTMAEDYEEQAARLAASSPPLVPSEAPEPPKWPRWMSRAGPNISGNRRVIRAAEPKNSTLKQSDNCGKKLEHPR